MRDLNGSLCRFSCIINHIASEVIQLVVYGTRKPWVFPIQMIQRFNGLEFDSSSELCITHILLL
jgi:hypothetical protein